MFVSVNQISQIMLTRQEKFILCRVINGNLLSSADKYIINKPGKPIVEDSEYQSHYDGDN
jgi:hypothetical protein